MNLIFITNHVKTIKWETRKDFYRYNEKLQDTDP